MRNTTGSVRPLHRFASRPVRPDGNQVGREKTAHNRPGHQRGHERRHDDGDENTGVNQPAGQPDAGQNDAGCARALSPKLTAQASRSIGIPAAAAPRSGLSGTDA